MGLYPSNTTITDMFKKLLALAACAASLAAGLMGPACGKLFETHRYGRLVGKSIYLRGNMPTLHNFNNKASGIYVTQNHRVMLCTEENFKGTCKRFDYQGTRSLGALDDKVKSVQCLRFRR